MSTPPSMHKGTLRASSTQDQEEGRAALCGPYPGFKERAVGGGSELANEGFLGPPVRETLSGVSVQPPLEWVRGSAVSLLDTTCVCEIMERDGTPI